MHSKSAQSPNPRQSAIQTLSVDVYQSNCLLRAWLTLRLDTAEGPEHIYGVRSDGGQIFTKMSGTPFASRFAMLRDRFGTSGMLLHARDIV